MKLSHISFAYGDKKVLEDFSLELPSQGISMITGPSGCGKTTLLRLLAGLEKPDSGKIEGIKPEHTAILFQENRLLPDLTAERQISAVLPKGESSEKWLRGVGLYEERSWPADKLSGGMKRRLALARCLSYGRNAKLLLLDEPFTGVDERGCQSIMTFIRCMNLPVLCVSHDRKLFSLADRVLDFDGPPLSLRQNPL